HVDTPIEDEARPEEALTREEAMGIEKKPDPQDIRKLTTEQIIEGAYRNAMARAEKHAAAGQWGKALHAIREVDDAYDDMATRRKCQAAIEGLHGRAEVAYGKAKDEAEGLVRQGQYDAACAVLQKVVDTFGMEGFVEKARERAAALQTQKWDEAENDYRTRMAPMEALLPEWKFDEALAGAEALTFRYEKYQKLLAARIARMRGLVALRKKMVTTVNGALPRIKKSDVRAPGLPGTLAEAGVEGVTCQTQRGEEKVSWVKLGPEAILRLALMAGSDDDAGHRLAAARLLMEVGRHTRAKQQLALAQRLGADTTADEEELAARMAGAAK
ncbi:hypothetical protein HQ560_19095, partial [bacterium]|nr:hypothetical protein [bacterium]